MVSVAPLYLVHPLMEAPFLSPANVWHMLNVKVRAVGIAHQVGPLMEWIRA